LRAAGQRRIRRAEKAVEFGVKRGLRDAAKRFVIQIGDARIKFQTFDARKDFGRGARQDGNAHVRVAGGKGCCQFGDHRQRGGNDAKAQIAGKPGMHRPHFGLERTHIARDAARPIQHALAFGGKPLESRAAKHQLHAKLVFKLADGRRQAGLGDAAGFGSAAKVTLVCKGYKHFKFVDHRSRVAGICLRGKGGGDNYALINGGGLHGVGGAITSDSMMINIPFLKRPPLVPVIRLAGTIGSGRNGLNDAGLAGVIEKAFKMKPAAVALVINSPGGSAVQSSLIAARVRRLAEEKGVKVHAFVEDVAASGGYWLACAADDIFVDPSSIVGSIGVIFASFGFPELMAKQGVERRVVTAGKSKSFADPFLPQKPEDIERLRTLQEPIHAAFIAHVKARRGARLADADLFNADIWVGQGAVDLGLADGVAHLVPKLKSLYGDKVRLVPLGQKRGFLGRFGLNLADDALSSVEDRAIWARFGL
jgi:signal peptide peptidase SppA